MKDLLRIADLSPQDLMHLLDAADTIRQAPHGPTWPLTGDTVITYFAKPSTRTRLSFGSAISTARRHPGGRRARRAPARTGRDDRGHGPGREPLRPGLRDPDLRRRGRAALRGRGRLDPGDQRPHRRPPPCQALADLMTLRQHFGGLAGLRSPTWATATTWPTASWRRARSRVSTSRSPPLPATSPTRTSSSSRSGSPPTRSARADHPRPDQGGRGRRRRLHGRVALDGRRLEQAAAAPRPSRPTRSTRR